VTELALPVRYYRDYAPAYEYAYEVLSLPLEHTAFLIVDIDDFGYLPYREHTQKFIAPVLHAARTAKMHIVYIYMDAALSHPNNIEFEIFSKTKGLRRDTIVKPRKPQYLENVSPLEDEPVFGKRAWSGFHDTFLDQHLRALDIKTLVCVGYAVRACFYGTIVDAVYRNYRVIALRDCVYAPEFPDTVDANVPEGGWINRIMVRQIEHLIGYTSTSNEFMAACQSAE
jgi:nicotinamidase-related amidase